jgi:hypothetical protein
MQNSLRTTRLERILSTLGLGRHNKRQKDVGLLRRRISLEALEERMLLSVYHWTGNGSDNNWTTAPGVNEEFVGSGGVQQAVDPRAVDRVDLLSVVTHELGHALGSDDLAGDDSIMSGLLAAGTRRTSVSANDLALLSALD